MDFFQVAGKIFIVSPTYVMTNVFSFTTGIWHQYNTEDGYKVGDFYFPSGPGTVRLAARSALMPLLQGNNPHSCHGVACVAFIAPSPASSTDNYAISEEDPNSKGWLDDSYYITSDVNNGFKIIDETFSFSNDSDSSGNLLYNYAIDEFTTFNIATGTAQTITGKNYFTFTKTDLATVTSIGYPNNALQFWHNRSSTPGYSCGHVVGRGIVIPAELIPDLPTPHCNRK